MANNGLNPWSITYDELFDFSDRRITEGDSVDSEIHRPSTIGINIDRQMQQHIDRQSHKHTIDEATNRGRLVPKVKSDMYDTHNHGEEISTDTCTTLMRHQFNLESLGDRLQKIENTIATMKDKWSRREEAMRDLTGTKAGLQPN
uniref:Uncharacterized protein n=1 Tax=Brassica campestris TaxID=3711 RepID=M4F965_BRACM